MNSEKQANPIGTLNEHAFQLSLKHRNGELQLPLLDYYGFPTITCCGVYGDEYEPLIPNVILELPFESLINYRQSIISKEEEISIFNEELDVLTKSIDPTIPTEFYILIHPKPKSSLCQHFQCENSNEMSVMFHPWVFRDVQLRGETEYSEVAQVGLFCPSDNVVTSHQDIVEETARGMAFNQLENRCVCIHNMRFSPANCQIQLLEDQEVYSFFCFCRIGEKQILTFHVLPQNDDIEGALDDKIKHSNTLGQLLSSLEGIRAMNNAVKIMRMLIDNCSKEVDEQFVKELEHNYHEHQETQINTQPASTLAYIF